MAGWGGYEGDAKAGIGEAPANDDGPVKGGWGGGFAGFHDLAAGYPEEDQAEDAAEDANDEDEIDVNLDESITATVSLPEGIATVAPPEDIVSVDNIEIIAEDEGIATVAPPEGIVSVDDIEIIAEDD